MQHTLGLSMFFLFIFFFILHSFFIICFSFISQPVCHFVYPVYPRSWVLNSCLEAFHLLWSLLLLVELNNDPKPSQKYYKFDTSFVFWFKWTVLMVPKRLQYVKNAWKMLNKPVFWLPNKKFFQSESETLPGLVLLKFGTQQIKQTRENIRSVFNGRRGKKSKLRRENIHWDEKTKCIIFTTMARTAILDHFLPFTGKSSSL